MFVQKMNGPAIFLSSRPKTAIKRIEESLFKIFLFSFILCMWL